MASIYTTMYNTHIFVTITKVHLFILRMIRVWFDLDSEHVMSYKVKPFKRTRHIRDQDNEKHRFK